MKTKPYKAKSLRGAERRVRELQLQIAYLKNEVVGHWTAQAHKFRAEAELMAMLAADGPAFTDPILAMEAKKRRDQILARIGLAPDGKGKPK